MGLFSEVMHVYVYVGWNRNGRIHMKDNIHCAQVCTMNACCDYYGYVDMVVN